RTGIADLLDDRGCGVDVVEADHEQHALWRRGNQTAADAENGNTGAFAADQRTSNMKALFGQQFVEIIARNAAWNLWVAGAHQIAIPIAHVPKTGINFSPPAALGDGRRKLVLAGRPDQKPQPVMGQDLQLLDIVGG